MNELQHDTDTISQSHQDFRDYLIKDKLPKHSQVLWASKEKFNSYVQATLNNQGHEGIPSIIGRWEVREYQFNDGLSPFDPTPYMTIQFRVHLWSLHQKEINEVISNMINQVKDDEKQFHIEFQSAYVPVRRDEPESLNNFIYHKLCFQMTVEL